MTLTLTRHFCKVFLFDEKGLDLLAVIIEIDKINKSKFISRITFIISPRSIRISSLRTLHEEGTAAIMYGASN